MILLNILSNENHYIYVRRAMDHSVLAIYTMPVLLLYIDTTYALENLALGKPTWEQHPWPETDVDFGSENAVDGLYTDRGQGGQCTISENKQSTAEWRVDLGSVVSISHIDIHYRTDNIPQPSPYVNRMAGFFLYVSNTTLKEDGYLCFHEIQTVAGTPAEDQTIRCSVHGRYIIYYNERRQGVVYPSYYSQYAYNELCEVEVYDISPGVQTTIKASLPFTTTSGLLSTFKTSTIESTLKDNPTSSSFNTIESIPPNVAYHSTLETTSTTLSLCVIKILHFKSNSLVLREGSSAWFELLVLNNTMYERKWFHDGNLITSSSTRFVITTFLTENGTSKNTLHIANILQRDKGEWKVVISNSLRYATRNLTLNVIPRLVIQMKPGYDFSILSGEGINLQCTVSNPESLIDVNDGNLIIRKDGSLLADVSKTNVSINWSKSAATGADSGSYTCLHTGYPDPVFVSINIIVIQPEQKRCQSEMSDGIFWTITLAGSIKQENCPGNKKGIATRYCDSSGVWQSPSLINCTNEILMNASTQLNSILEDGVQNTDKIQETVNSTLRLMNNLTSSSNEISAGDLSASLDILEKIVTVTNNTGSTIEEDVFYSVVDNVLSTNNSKSWTTVSEKTEKDASFILKNMERLGEVVIQNDNITATGYSGFNFDLTINRTQLAENGIRFPELHVSSKNDSVNVEDVSTFLELPKQDQKNEDLSNKTAPINYVAVIYKTMAEILPSSLGSAQKADQEEKSETITVVNSLILSLTTQTGLGVLVPPLNLTFKHVENVSIKNS
nr:uncharacterized protein LOC105326226 [Crassostrea gigas]